MTGTNPMCLCEYLVHISGNVENSRHGRSEIRESAWYLKTAPHSHTVTGCAHTRFYRTVPPTAPPHSSRRSGLFSFMILNNQYSESLLEETHPELCD